MLNTLTCYTDNLMNEIFNWPFSLEMEWETEISVSWFRASYTSKWKHQLDATN